MVKQIRKVHFMGEDWRIIYNTKLFKKLTKDLKLEDPIDNDRGGCFLDQKLIYLSPKLFVVGNNKELMDTVIHELLHGFMWWLDEEYVEDIATDIAKVLIRMGFKCD